jgi:hypothetical protein
VKMRVESGLERNSKGINVTAEEVMMTRFTEGVLFAAWRMEFVTSIAGWTMSRS